MGLGKTIEVIALILHLKTDMQPKRSGGKGKSSATAVEISDMEVVDLTGDRPVVTAGIKEEHVGSNPDDNQVSASSATSSNQKLAENSSETMMLDDDEDVAMNVTANAAGVGGDDVVDNINDAIFDKINNSSNNVGGGGGDVGDDDDDDIIIIEHVKPASTPSASSSTNNDIQITSAAINPDAKSASRPPILPPPAKNMMEKLKNLFGGNTQLVQSGYFNKSVKTELPLSNPDIKLIKSKATLIVCPLSTGMNYQKKYVRVLAI